MDNLPLSGIKVLDLTLVLAGPTCGRTLAQYGAEVIKIDPDHRIPGLTPWIDVGRGKKSICLNITKKGGLEAFLKLAETADVIIEGFRKGVTDRLGIGYTELKKKNPKIVYASINCFGQSGPWSLRPGFEQNAQAATGIQVRNSGGISYYPRTATYTLNDYGTGLAAAYAVILALIERQKTGKGQRVEAALTYTSANLSGGFHTFNDEYNHKQNTNIVNSGRINRIPADNPGGVRRVGRQPGLKGTNMFNRLYETKNGWLFLSAPISYQEYMMIPIVGYLNNVPEFSHIAELAHTSFAGMSDKDPEEEMYKIFLTQTTEYWINLLHKHGIEAVKNTSSEEIFNDEYNHERKMIMTQDYENWGTATWSGNPVSINSNEPFNVSPPQFGEHTFDVLKDVGISENEIKNLIESGAIPETVPINLK